MEQLIATNTETLHAAMQEGFNQLEDKLALADQGQEQKSSEINAYVDKISSELEMAETSSKQESDELQRWQETEELQRASKRKAEAQADGSTSKFEEERAKWKQAEGKTYVWPAARKGQSSEQCKWQALSSLQRGPRSIQVPHNTRRCDLPTFEKVPLYEHFPAPEQPSEPLIEPHSTFGARRKNPACTSIS